MFDSGSVFSASLVLCLFFYFLLMAIDQVQSADEDLEMELKVALNGPWGEFSVCCRFRGWIWAWNAFWLLKCDYTYKGNWPEDADTSSDVLFFSFSLLQKTVSSWMPSLSSAAESSASSTTAVSLNRPPPPSPPTSSWRTLRGFTAPHWGNPNLRRALPPQTQKRRLNKAIWINNRPRLFSASSQTPYRAISSQGLSSSSSNILLLVWRMSSVRQQSPAQACPRQVTTWEAGAHRLRLNHTGTRRPRCPRRKRRRRTAVHAAWSWSRRFCLCSKRTRSCATSWRTSQVK